MTERYRNNFNGDTTGALSPGWANRGSANLLVNTTSPLEGAKSFGQDHAGTDGLCCSYTGQSALTDQDVTLLTKVAAAGSGNVALGQPYVCDDGTGNNHYLALPTSTLLYIFERTGGSYGPLNNASHGLSLPIGTMVRIRIQREAAGNFIRGKIWIDGSAEPGSWLVTTTDSSRSSGEQGVRLGSTGTAAFVNVDEFVVSDLASDTTAPVLTSPTGAATSTSTATGGATTDEANGTFYNCWTTSATTPTALQVESGQDSAGATAAAAANSAVSSTGAKTNNAAGLAPSTTYYAHSMHKDAAGNRSNVVTSASFTTSAADTTPPTLSAATGAATGNTTATGGATTDEANGTMYAIASLVATKPSVAQIQAGQTNTGAAAQWSGNQAIGSTGAKTFNATGLTAGTGYYIHTQHKDAAGNNSTVITSALFTTTGGADTTPPTLAGSIAVGTILPTSIAISWPAGADNLAVTSYEVSKNGGSTWTDTGSTATNYTFTGLQPGVSYAMRVRAKDAATNVSTPALAATQTTGDLFGVTDANIYFNPISWYSDGAGAMQANNVKASSSYAWCNMRGGYLKFKATVGAAGWLALKLDTTSLAGLNAAGCPRIAWSVNGAAIQTQLLVSGDTQLTLATGLAAGVYEVFVWFRGVYITLDGDSAQNYTVPNNKFHVTGLVLSPGGSLGAPAVRPYIYLALGDSITEGDLSVGAPRSGTSQDAHLTYAWYVAEVLNAEVAIVGFYGKAWSWLNSSWPNYAAGLSRLVGGLLTPAPHFITINYGHNDGNPGPSAASVTATLAAIAAAAPTAKIGLVIPFTGVARTNLMAATLPSNGVRIDLARYEAKNGSFQWSDDGVHPNYRGHANIGPLLGYAFKAAVPGTALRTVTVPVTLNGSAPVAAATGLKWAFFDSPQPNLFGAPASQGTDGVITGGSVASVNATTSLVSGGIGWLDITDSNGDPAMDHKIFSGPVMVP